MSLQSELSNDSRPRSLMYKCHRESHSLIEGQKPTCHEILNGEQQKYPLVEVKKSQYYCEESFFLMVKVEVNIKLTWKRSRYKERSRNSQNGGGYQRVDSTSAHSLCD